MSIYYSPFSIQQVAIDSLTKLMTHVAQRSPREVMNAQMIQFMRD